MTSLNAAPSLLIHFAQVNVLFELENDDHEVQSLQDLTDGVAFAYILHQLDPEFDPSHVTPTAGPSKYLSNKRNIQLVYKGLFRFIRRSVPDLGCQAKKFDYHAIADNPDPQGLSQVCLQHTVCQTRNHFSLIKSCQQLMAVMVSAATMGPDNQIYVPRVQNGLDRDTQGEIMKIIRAMQEDNAKTKDNEEQEDAIDAVLEARDIDLLVEEQNVALRQQLESTKKTLSDYITRLEHLQLSYEELQYVKEENDRELEVLRKATQDGASSAEAVKLLENRVHEQMDIIARYEETIRNHERAKAHLETEVSKLNQKNRQVDELRDQVTEWKHKAEDFEKRANTADRFRQKLESQQNLAREVQNLQYERAELQEQLRILTDDNERNSRMRKAEDELTKMITQSEQHLWDERNQKNQLMKDVAALEDELMRLKAQRSHDENYISDLQEQLHQENSGTYQGNSLGVQITASTLEDELKQAGDETNFPLEASRLKAENDLLRRTVGSTGDAALLRRDLEEEKRQRDRLQQNYNEMFEKNALAQDQIEVLINNTENERSVKAIDEASWLSKCHVLTSQFYRTKAFGNLRTELVHTQHEIERLKRAKDELQAKCADKERELLSANSQLSALSKEGAAALDELKSTDKLISESLKSALDHLRNEHNFVLRERDAQRVQLIEALLAKDKFRKNAEDSKELQDAAATAANEADISEAAKKANDKIDKLRTRLKERQQVSPLGFSSRQDGQRAQHHEPSPELARSSRPSKAACKDERKEKVLICSLPQLSDLPVASQTLSSSGSKFLPHNSVR